ncbi:saccharopine dehydrogenase NADP-binding domain-containing protein [Amycolatopsis rhabdoformis]|uniref:Saccharopine dehydrogenase NADP-binding domain-containing protein n=1 Tax=Amycolatopsis rhabdoformis TaxID=1448059 RepID=A0ABZ1HWT2_9PSEU|nr:saccharopine dehydrogenase NADP-binding domain-containing protein [Amycolatopsis rhabdoformis]WSE26012.1 saccharopine dehydrogenase NADP-binding domain-containing protein [Amycolatopsis rhabdoformis]
MADYDLVLFGATGFTGTLTAEYLARSAPPGCRWALAGRNRAKLSGVRDRLAAIDERLGTLPLLSADIADPASLRALAASTKVVATTVGPYLHYGEPLVAACAAEGTDYVDLTGEPEFVDRMYLAHHATAAATGARLVHSCGFDSIPHDLGAWYTVRQLPADVPLRVDGYVRVGALPSGGTFLTAMTAFSRQKAANRAAAERAAVEPAPQGRRVRVPVGGPHRVPGTGQWAVPLPTIDPQVVGHSARAVARYGPDFRYRHFAAFAGLPSMVGATAGAGALFTAAQLAPAREALSKLLAPGQGPSLARRAKSWFSVRFLGEGGGERVTTEVAGGDPGYDETAKMLAESALCLAFDALPDTAGQVTTAAAMGDALIERLTRAGLVFRTL